MLILDSNRLENPRGARETGVYHDRPEPCIARLLDPDRHVESPTRSFDMDHDCASRATGVGTSRQYY